METEKRIFFAPGLFIGNGVKDISFYKEAFRATENMRFSNDDGSIHVTEFSISGAVFFLHEATEGTISFFPTSLKGTIGGCATQMSAA
jgi:PhnB protein